MKKVLTLRGFSVLALAITLVSCSSGSKNTSSATGWEINSNKGGFQYNTDYQEQETSPGLVFIEGGTFTKGQVQDDVMHDWNNTPNQQHVQSFYMDETEVTNMMYIEYLQYLKRVYPPSEELYKSIYTGALPDTLVWRARLGYNEVMTENYLRHPAYRNYPVVGVSWIQASEYATWRSDQVTQGALQREGYLKKDSHVTDITPESAFNTDTYISAPTETFGGNEEVILPKGARKSAFVDSNGNEYGLFATRGTGVIPPKYRLPTEAEWEFAALGMSEIRDYNIYRGRKKYPWNGRYTRSGKRATRGDQKANFKIGKGDYGGIGGWSDDGADITNAVKSYEPNDYGLYDMAGNVAEWVADVYRPIIDDKASDFNYFRGNVYTKNSITEEGTVEIVTVDDIIYDTLPDGKIIARQLPGEIKQVPVDEDETYLRTNFSRSNQINFRDGDQASSRFFEDFGDEEKTTPEGETRKMMYNSPKHSITVDDDGEFVRAHDKNVNRTTLINDEVRVYKGGSWKDREYWLDPAQRRYYPQDKATDYIGFRCAMSRVGAKSNMKKKTRY